MNLTTITTKEKRNSRKEHSTTPAPPTGEADDSSQKYLGLPIPPQKLISNNYERDNDKMTKMIKSRDDKSWL